MNKITISVMISACLAACSGGGEDTNAQAPVGAQAQMAAAADGRVQALAVSSLDQASLASRSTARDPGPRASRAAAGAPLAGLSPLELAAFNVGKADFAEAESADEEGMGPTMNLDSCGGCHSQPDIGGSAPAVNPQIALASKLGATNKIPSFLSLNGPVREARFVRNPDGTPDGGVHAIFTVAGRSDAVGCDAKQPDFATALANRNVVFRIPTPVFGAGLIEQIPDREILANLAKNASARQGLGIRGRGNVVMPANGISGQANRNGNDGTLGRFGWKAQNKSLLVFSGEAYNVEMGVTNDLFPTERDENENCQFVAQPNNVADQTAATPAEQMSGIEKFATYMRLLAPPQASTHSPGGGPSITAGRALFDSTGCALCHTPSMKTGNARIDSMRAKTVNLFSDLLIHDMGIGLADGVSQGQANGREFRSAPLWGLGQRLYFLHDGRTMDLRQAVIAHRSEGSEANEVVARFTRLADREQQDLLNFLRSL